MDPFSSNRSIEMVRVVHGKIHMGYFEEGNLYIYRKGKLLDQKTCKPQDVERVLRTFEMKMGIPG